MRRASSAVPSGTKPWICAIVLYAASVLVMLLMYGSSSRLVPPSERLAVLAGAYSHELLDALFYTPGCLALLVPQLDGITSPLLVVRRNGFADALRCTLRSSLFLSLLAGLAVAAGLSIEAMLLGCADMADTSFWLLWTLTVCMYFASCALLLIVLCIAAGRKAAVLGVLGYGLFSYFLGASPLRSIAMLHFGWMIVQDVQAGIGVAAASLARQLFICIAAFISAIAMAEVSDVPSGADQQ
ncbi:MAG: hypothetical protein LKE27_00100 [Atopobiaceae bacterium]|jgi:hypothetical protein|nr:hypothetical protein [Atopobiaceae bacterium]MCI2050642.1 hypothetical protein [Atopobiaceae bacterium]